MDANERNIDDVLCHALYSTAQATVQLYRDLLAPWGVSFQQLMVLGVLWRDGEQTPGGIAEALSLDSSSVAGLLGRMQSAGLIERAIDPTDRRRIQVRATAKAVRLRGELDWLESCVTEALGVSVPEAQDLAERLRSLRSNVQAFARERPLTAGLVDAAAQTNHTGPIEGEEHPWNSRTSK